MSITQSTGEGILENPTECPHVVQFHGADDAVLIDNLCRYIAEGWKRGEAALIITIPVRAERIFNKLSSLGFDPDAALRDGRMAVLDAHETLPRFMVDGKPDRVLLESTINPVIGGLRLDAGLRTYGEMAGILWEAGQFAAAVRLEHFWNRMIQKTPFSLFCNYPLDIFGRGFQTEAVEALMCAHTHVLPTLPNLSESIKSAIEQLDHPRHRRLFDRFKLEQPKTWAWVPEGEAMILWLRQHFDRQADQILARARQIHGANSY